MAELQIWLLVALVYGLPALIGVLLPFVAIVVALLAFERGLDRLR